MTETSGLLSPHVGDRAAFSASSEVATLPASHLLTPEAWQVWRAAANAARLVWDFNEPTVVDTALFAGLRHTPTAVARALWGASVHELIYAPNIAKDWAVIDATGRPDARLYPNRRSLLRFTAVTCGAFAVEISDPANGEPLEAWRAMVGDMFQPASGIDHELSRPIEVADIQVARFGGGRSTGARGRVKGYAARWSHLTRAETDRLEEIAMLCGAASDVFFVLDPSDTTRLQRDSVLGPFVPGSPDIADIPEFPGTGPALQMSRADIRIIEGNP